MSQVIFDASCSTFGSFIFKGDVLGFLLSTGASDTRKLLVAPESRIDQFMIF